MVVDEEFRFDDQDGFILIVRYFFGSNERSFQVTFFHEIDPDDDLINMLWKRVLSIEILCKI